MAPVLLFLALMALALQARAQAGEPAVVAVVLNANVVSDGQIVYPADDGRGYWVDVQALAAWRLRADGPARRVFERREHQLVCSQAASMRCLRDEAAALLTIEADASRIEALRLAAPVPAAPHVEPAAPSSFYANYDLFAAGGSAQAAPVFSAYADARLLSPAGEFYLRSGWIGGTASDGSVQRRLAARAAGWSWDWPETQRTLTLGGFISDGSVQRGALGIVGARYASNAQLRPQFSRLPRPLVGGEVARPSRAELFVDGMFRRAVDVPYGRFEFEADGLLAGAGELQMLLTDARGEQTVLRERYYIAPQLLAAGLSEFTLEAGRAGPDLALLSPARGATVVSAQRRWGFSDATTLGTHGLAGRGAGLGGVTVDHLLQAGAQPLGVTRAAAALLDRGQGLRARWLLGHEYQDSRWAGLVRAEWAPRDRVAPAAPLQSNQNSAVQAVLPGDRLSLLAALNLSLGAHWQVGGSLTRRTTIDNTRTTIGGVTATWRGAQRWQVTTSLQRLSGASRDTLALVGVIIPIERHTLASVSATRSSGVSALQWSLQNLRDPADADAQTPQVRLFGRTGADEQSGASLVADERFGQWAVEASTSAPRRTSRAAARVSGAVGLAAGQPFFARRIDDGFILVDSDGQPGLPVFLENRFAGTTNASGHLVVAGARAWQANRISVDTAALPIEYTVTEDQLSVVPRSRALAVARFEISDGGELVAVRRADGSRLPAGARASISTQRRAAAVNSRSELFVQRAGRVAQVDVQWPGGSCRFEYQPASSTPTAMASPAPQAPIDSARSGAFLCV